MAGSIITLAAAAAMTAEFRKNHPNATKAVYYTNDVFEDIMTQEGCEGIRIYFGIDEDDKLNTVLVGVDDKDNDILSGIIYERGIKCPPNCPQTNPLNS